ncbi:MULTISPECIES: hypothetical protein [Pseudomonas]|uniref:Uncharacterized protein n=1 Tax=Pseudomonas fluorescens TaxID=294 RepID=A0A109KQ95_PSEFL|nr:MULTISPECIES: hypothetical protein [Pseudomonas]KWV73400.1 hypothetical protein PFL603g_03510 [Pseudomonas fluorescens]QHD08585.1 hypothetical protein PspR76_23940 [Pseudomonas sp. R76]TFW40894.1 hypothetical protein E4T65_23895 [Pseudomonas fluorescens]
MPSLYEDNPEFTRDLINSARRIAKAHGCRMIKPQGRMSLHEWGMGMFRIVDAEGKIVAGRRHELTPRAVARHFGEEL